MKSTNVKAMVVKGMTVGLLAGAFVLAAPAKAQAQGWQVGVAIGGYPPAPYGYSREYYERLRCERQEAFERQQAYAREQAYLEHEAWERHGREEAFERQRAFGYGEGRYREDHHRDRDDRRRDHDGR
jgi:hypothetical protein